MPTRAQNIAINMGLLCGSLLFFIGMAEIALRVTGIEKGKVIPPPIYQTSANPNISYELKPNMEERAFRSTITTNSLGLRSPEIDASKPVLAVLGDSITFGYGVENDESLPARLQALLPDYAVANGAVPGYNMLQEAATYETKLKPLGPEALVLVFYWNDMQDLEPAILHENGNLYPKGFTPPPRACAPITEGILGMIPGKCWLDTHSAVYRVVKKAVIARTERQNQLEQIETLGKDEGYEYIPEDKVLTWQKQFEDFAKTLPAEMPKLFVIWPERPLHAALRPRLKAIAEAQGFAVVDLYATFGNHPETHSWDTVHPNAETLRQASLVVKVALEKILP